MAMMAITTRMFNQREILSGGPGGRPRRGKKEQRQSRCDERLVTRQRHPAGQNGDDGDYDEKFNQRESIFFHSASLSRWRFFLCSLLYP
jgi:hypothetical protein